MLPSEMMVDRDGSYIFLGAGPRNIQCPRCKADLGSLINAGTVRCMICGNVILLQVLTLQRGRMDR
mgnify:CR=1 FL=1